MRPMDRSGDERVLVHAVQEPLDDAERDEAAHVHLPHRFRVLHAPGFDAVALS